VDVHFVLAATVLVALLLMLARQPLPGLRDAADLARAFAEVVRAVLRG
jgi:hypothetical protein